MRPRLQEAGRFPWVRKWGKPNTILGLQPLNNPRLGFLKTLNVAKGSRPAHTPLPTPQPWAVFPTAPCKRTTMVGLRETRLNGMYTCQRDCVLLDQQGGKIWPINQAPAAWTKGSREQVRLWRGQLLLLGAARCQPQRVGQELGSWWPGKLLRGGMRWLRRPIVHPISHPGLGDTIVQACCLAGPTRVRPPSTTNVLQLEDQQVPGWDRLSDAWRQMSGSSLGSAGKGRGQAKGPSPLFVPFLSLTLYHLVTFSPHSIQMPLRW